MIEYWIKIGSNASFSKTVTESNTVYFAGQTKDFSSVYINDDVAKGSSLGTHITDGMLSDGFISVVLGTELPSEETRYTTVPTKHKNADKNVAVHLG